MAENGHGAPPIHYSQSFSYSFEQAFPFHFQVHQYFSIKKRSISLMLEISSAVYVDNLVNLL
jgi:hypothetical protein